ncbi:MAG: cupin-like domain-containing protein [Sphingobium sp.]|uniref:cupin-like domain-containing protein n=1 Tax=Sphingobium sp. TaxID=1912891 RepID=UPI0029B1CDD8|nr:cupin-like domain-containing protein [Sphingobium sp.]MDX3908733.1 cupin-like domain-containing protein [Sphingobium sp.]
MTIQRRIDPSSAAIQSAFGEAARVAFAMAYPDQSTKLDHQLAGHRLFSREALAQLAERMPEEQVEYNLGKLPLGVRPEDTPANGLSLSETIRTIDSNGSWVVIKNVECDLEYGAMLDAALAELAPMVERKTGPMLHREVFIFLSSPESVTPFHMDPEHNILLQIEGEKTMTVFPAGDTALVPPQQSEGFHGGAHRNLHWDEQFLAKGTAVKLLAGDGIVVPVKAPHFVRNGPAVSVSFSITWRSRRSIAEGELHSLNARLRRRGLPTVSVSAAPEAQSFHRLLYRLMRKLGA